MIIPKLQRAKALKTKVLDHLGLVAGMCKELKIGEQINNQIPNDSVDKILSVGHAVEGLILNGLGYVNKRLYLVPQFFKNKPVDKLLGVSYLKSEHFNDDALGRCLDDLYKYGVSELYNVISVNVVKHLSSVYGLEVEVGQLDITNFHLHGGKKELRNEAGEVIIEIRRGQSKDHRPDLVQVGLELIVEQKSRIPLLMEVLSGNAEESKSYKEFIQNHAKQLQNDYGIQIVVVDSKLYTRENISKIGGDGHLTWVTRVPHTLNAIEDILENSDKNHFKRLEGYEGYLYQEVCTSYGDVNQRWVILFSQDKYETQLKQFNKRLIKEKSNESKAYKKFSKREEATVENALAQADIFSKKLKYSNLANVKVVSKNYYDHVGKPKANEKPIKTTYRIEAEIVTDEQAIQAEKEKLGYFVLATNELDANEISAEQLLQHYKNQSGVERSFRFLKDPNIVGSSLFVQKPQRMMALLMIMTLCLLVYSALEFKTRTLLKEKQITFNNQLGKPSEKPTMSWIFQCFEGIHVLYVPDNKPIILNLEKQHVIILDLFGENYWKFYT